jgi:hypothetical protein
MIQGHRRHDMSDRVLLLLEPHLSARMSNCSGIAQDNRYLYRHRQLVENALLWLKG